MEPFTKAESYVGDVKLYLNPSRMQETMHSKSLTSQLTKEVRSKLTHLESNAKEFSKLTIGQVSINENHKSKNPPYEPVFPYMVRSDEKIKQSSSQDHTPLFKGIKQSNKVKFNDSQGAKAEQLNPSSVYTCWSQMNHFF
ncbi:UNVERIFIED_CONTAM: hypothetical protein Sradi_4025100 [Sesamum radiatum]|uniref:Uncharacterized protein n=1 Tax=Sesamum radiatum TaxID=300843 RepID=A0AAW2PL02_SESRA